MMVWLTFSPGVVTKSCCSCLPDEVATFLVYVKTLGYQEKPDYQRLRQVLSSGAGAGRIDFSLPGSAAAEATAEVQDTSSRDKVRTRRGSKVCAMFVLC